MEATHYASAMTNGAAAGGMRTLLGSTAPKMTMARKKSCMRQMISIREHGVQDAENTHCDKLIHEDLAEVAAGQDVKPEDTSGAVRSELDPSKN
jgi:hypothetical protein